MFYANHQVTSIQLLQNGEVSVHAVRKQCKVTKKDRQIVFTEQQTPVVFKAKAVIISNGGKQSIYSNFFRDFPFMKKTPEKLVDAGVFMKQEGFKTYM